VDLKKTELKRVLAATPAVRQPRFGRPHWLYPEKWASGAPAARAERAGSPDFDGVRQHPHNTASGVDL